MKKIVLRFLALLVGVFLGFSAYSEYVTPMTNDFREKLSMFSAAFFCMALLYYAITGNRKPFFPKWVPFKKKRK